MTKPKTLGKPLKAEKFGALTVGRALQMENAKLQNQIVKLQAAQISDRAKIKALEKLLKSHCETPSISDALGESARSLLQKIRS